MGIRKIFNGAVGISLAVCMMLATAGCGKKAKDFTYDSMEAIFQKHGAVKFGSYSEYEEDREKDIPEDVLKKGYCNYLYCEGHEAQEIFEYTITLVRSPYKVSQAINLEYGKYRNETSMDYVSVELLTFASEDEAEAFFKEETDTDGNAQILYEVSRSGKKDGYRYSIRRTDGQGGAMYQYKDKLLRIVFILGETENGLISDVCSEYGIMNPLKS